VTSALQLWIYMSLYLALAVSDSLGCVLHFQSNVQMSHILMKVSKISR